MVAGGFHASPTRRPQPDLLRSAIRSCPSKDESTTRLTRVALPCSSPNLRTPGHWHELGRDEQVRETCFAANAGTAGGAVHGLRSGSAAQSSSRLPLRFVPITRRSQRKQPRSLPGWHPLSLRPTARRDRRECNGDQAIFQRTAGEAPDRHAHSEDGSPQNSLADAYGRALSQASKSVRLMRKSLSPICTAGKVPVPIQFQSV
jgi:hypothetical protein